MEIAETIKTGAIDRPFEVETLFQSPDLLVRRVARGSGTVCYVTFDSYTDNRSLERSGFGEDFFRQRGIDAVHVISRDNYWYQHPELPEALAAVAAVTAGYAQVITYGSSMGGFAALHYGAKCGAKVGIAISPQYSVDPAVAPFEDRWLFDASRISHRKDPLDPLPLQYVLYDPQDVRDNAHYELFAATSPTIGLRVHYSGHPAGSYLYETGMFEPLFAGVQAGSLDPDGYERELRARRSRSGQYFFAMSRRVPAHRPRQRVALARVAAEVNAGNGIYVSNLATLLDEAGDHDEAGRQHHRALELMPDNLHVTHALAVHLENMGRLRAARVLVERLVKRFPDVLMLRTTRRRLRRATRQRHWYGRLAQRLRLDDTIDYGWEVMTDGVLVRGDLGRLLARHRQRVSSGVPS